MTVVWIKSIRVTPCIGVLVHLMGLGNDGGEFGEEMGY